MVRESPMPSEADIEKFAYAEELLKIKLHRGNTVLFFPSLRYGREDTNGGRAARRVPCIGQIKKVHAYEGRCLVSFITAEPVETKKGVLRKKGGRIEFSFEELRRAELQEFTRDVKETFGDVVQRATSGFRNAAERGLRGSPGERIHRQEQSAA